MQEPHQPPRLHAHKSEVAKEAASQKIRNQQEPPIGDADRSDAAVEAINQRRRPKTFRLTTPFSF